MAILERGWHARLPWDRLRRWYRAFRERYFSAPRHEGPHLVVEASLAELEAALGTRSYAPNWETSYHKRGEILNLAQVVYEGGAWMQTHVRGYVHDGGRVWLAAHYEYEPTEHPVRHISGHSVDVERGLRTVETALRQANIRTWRLEYPEDA